jgi:polyisoprenyl-phosphate glycosyltransferase
LIVLGILGEYIGRSYQESKKRPLYVLAGKFGFEEELAAKDLSGSTPLERV